jgi:hypothetical protein
MSDYADMVLFAQPNTRKQWSEPDRTFAEFVLPWPKRLRGGPRGTEASALEFAILAVLFLAFARVASGPSVGGRMRRNLNRLYVKELVLKNFAGLAAEQVADRMIELPCMSKRN